MFKKITTQNRVLWFLVTRVLGAIILLSIGSYLGQPGIWPDFPFDPPPFAVFLTAVVFGSVGFFLPDLIVIATKTGFRRFVDVIAARVSDSVVSSLPKRKRIKKAKKLKFDPGSVLLDTSAIVDPRLGGVADSGFLRGSLIISKTILTELRRMADSSDSVKRQRGRRALESLDSLKSNKNIRMVFIENFDQSEADDGLIEFASKNRLPIMTVDFNLAKVAQVRNIEVLSFNKLANAVKVDVVPGEKISLKLSQPGSVKDQGVGFLDDGTMVVVEKGGAHLGKVVNIEVIKSIQKESGRIIFASIV